VGTERFDVVVAGLGAMGSAAACHLAGGGARVLGLDRHSPPHALGSSHGETRIIREAYFEHPAYVPLVQRAYRLWEELEGVTGRTLVRRTGALMLGSPESSLIHGALASAAMHGLPHERLDPRELRRRFPAFRLGEEMVAVLEAQAGILDPEGCVAAHLEVARAQGAELRPEEPVLAWRHDARGVEVTTARGRYRAGHLVLAVGPWLADLVPTLPFPVERQVMLWFRPRGAPADFAPGRFPAFLWELPEGQLFYGMPDLGNGVKAARHHGGETGTAHTVDASLRAEDVEEVRRFLQRHIPGAAGELLRGVVCRYTNSPTGHFLIDRHPESERVLLVSPCSGHGFKFASVVGEVVADLVREGATRHDISLFCRAG
jgi:sarcosine oxidase